MYLERGTYEARGCPQCKQAYLHCLFQLLELFGNGFKRGKGFQRPSLVVVKFCGVRRRIALNSRLEGAKIEIYPISPGERPRR